MNEEHGITLENLLRIFPEAIARDKSIYAFADAAAQLLVKRRDETDIPRIFPEIDRLDEAVLDLLAYDLKVDWYNYDYPIKTKRELIKNSVLVHKQMGTVYAVKSVLNSMYTDYDLEEWFSYDGTPGCFRLNVNINSMETGAAAVYSAAEILRRIDPVKRLSAHLEGVSFTFYMPPSVLHVGGAVGTLTEFGVPEESSIYDFRETLHVGGAAGTLAELGIPEKPNTYDFRHSLHVGGTAGMHTQTSVPAAPNNLDFTGALHVGGNGGIHVTIPPDAAPPPFSIQRMGNVCTIIMDPPEGS